MIKVESFYSELINNGIEFFTGVPDSLLKDICAYITENTKENHHIIAANEGAAISLGAGYNIASSRLPLVYMQNSGLGNTVNPLLSLVDKEVYSIPMILIIGWRGEPGVKDEPQHIKQGRITPSLLETMEIPYVIVDSDSNYKEIIKDSVDKAINSSSPFALLIRKGAFEPYKLKDKGTKIYELSREQALDVVIDNIPSNSVIVSTTGMLSRELYEIREKKSQSHETDFLTVGSMGHTTQIALGIALAQPDKSVFCFDGDGSAIMHLGSYAILGNIQPKNLKIIILNNEAHDSVGGQPTVGDKISFTKMGDAVNLKSIGCVETKKDLLLKTPELVNSNRTALLEIKVKKGARKDLGRPKTSPVENKELLKKYLNV